MRRIIKGCLYLLLVALALGGGNALLPSAEPKDDPVRAAQAYRKPGLPVLALAETTLVCEAEEFQVEQPGWRARPWGTNYYAATLANTFLSRKAYLGAPEQCERSVATIEVQVPKSGRYLALVRYEAVYRFETQFRLQVEQGGKTRLDRLYGARDNSKVWAFRQKLKNEVGWDWGACENIVWEGHDAFVDLDAGKAKLSLVADKQPGNAARRNVDLVMLTSDEAQVKMRIDKENYLPLDGMLTQEGDVYLKLHNHKDSPSLTLTVPPGTEHSPYWIHLRNWKPRTIAAEPGQSTEWIEVGSLLDTLNDGQWNLTAKSKTGTPRFSLEFGVRAADGKLESVKRFDDLTGSVTLAYDADTRYTRRIRLADDVLHDLVAYLKKQPVEGIAPKRTLIYGYTFTHRPGDDKYNAAVDEFIRLTGATALTIGGRGEIPDDRGLIRGYTDLRSIPTAKLEEHCKKLQAEGKADRIAVVSLGDEIGLPPPPAKDHPAFRDWLKGRGLKPAEVDPAAGDNWEKVVYSPGADTAKSKPSLFYYSKVYGYRFGIQALKQRTDILRRHLPHAGIGANFSPHHGHAYLGATYHWISIFREDGMTMPWGEDYIWQVPVGSQQVSTLMLDMFRAGVRHRPEAKIHFYVMPHWPGNTPAGWRRQFYGALAHGAKVLNLFEYRPVQAAYTENHVSLPEMYQEVRRALHELGRFEDVVQDGRVRPARAGLWFSEAADVWDDNRDPFAAGKRSLFIALRHLQLPLDVIVEGDDLKGCQVLYLTDRHVSRAASKAIVEWVSGGGRLVATAGAGMFDELYQPNKVLRELLGVDEKELLEAKDGLVRYEKQDLPFVKPMDQAAPVFARSAALPVIGVRTKVATAAGVEVQAKFISDGSPAITQRKAGKGSAAYWAFLPGLSYFKPAIPLRPVDRATTDDAMCHFIPTEFDSLTSSLLAQSADGVERPVVCSQALVETTVIESKQGVVIPLINWSAGPIKGLTVTLAGGLPGKQASLASGKPVRVVREGGKQVLTLDLDVADALILR